MLKNKKLTYVTLFSSGGAGCFGLKMEGFQCVATNEIVAKLMTFDQLQMVLRLTINNEAFNATWKIRLIHHQVQHVKQNNLKNKNAYNTM